MRTSIPTMIAAGAIGLASSLAGADIITINGNSSNSTEGLGSFSGSIEYNYQSGDHGQLIIDLSNTTSPNLGGYITAFVFNIGAPERSGADTAALLTSTHSSLVNIPGPGINGAPFGLFDGGAGTGAQFGGGGSPNGGIAAGSSGTFEFLVTSAYANVLTATSFVSGPNEFDFVVRFRGFAAGGSDKVPVPVPGSLALMSLGAIAMGSRRRRQG